MNGQKIGTHKDKRIYVYCVLIFLLICSYANYQIIHFDGRGYLILSFAWLFILTGRNIQYYIKQPPVIIWSILMAYHIINAIIKKSDNLTEQSIVSQTLISITLMILVSKVYVNNKELLYKFLIISTYYYLLIAYLYGDTETYGGRLSGFIYTTQLGQLAGVSCMIISMYIIYKKKWTLFYLYIYPIFIMLLAGARNGFLMVAFAFVCLAVPFLFKRKRVLILLVFIVLILINSFINTQLYERLITGAQESPLTTGTIWDDILGDRIFYYIVGYQNFIDNPITGIGLLNFSRFNFYNYPIHSEIMTHLAEGGLIALILYLSFKFYYIKFFIRNCSKNTIVLNQCLILFVSLAVLGLTARIYQYSFFFIIYGIINGEIIRITNNTDRI